MKIEFCPRVDQFNSLTIFSDQIICKTHPTKVCLYLVKSFLTIISFIPTMFSTYDKVVKCLMKIISS